MATHCRAPDAPTTLYEEALLRLDRRSRPISLRARRFEALDLENLIEEVEEPSGRAEKKEVLSNATVIVEHLLKLRVSPATDRSIGLDRLSSWSIGSELEYELDAAPAADPRATSWPGSMRSRDALPSADRAPHGEDAGRLGVRACPLHAIDQDHRRLVAVTSRAATSAAGRACERQRGVSAVAALSRARPRSRR